VDERFLYWEPHAWPSACVIYHNGCQQVSLAAELPGLLPCPGRGIGPGYLHAAEQ